MNQQDPYQQPPQGTPPQPPGGPMPPGYGPPQGYQPAYAPHRGGLVLALGILGLVLCMFCGIAAWVMGNTDLREMAAGRMDPEGRGLTEAGRIMGIISVVLSIGALVIGILVLGVAAGSQM